MHRLNIGKGLVCLKLVYAKIIITQCSSVVLTSSCRAKSVQHVGCQSKGDHFWSWEIQSFVENAIEDESEFQPNHPWRVNRRVLPVKVNMNTLAGGCVQENILSMSVGRKLC